MLHVVAATPYDLMNFQRRTVLAGALHKLSSRRDDVKTDVTYCAHGLPEVYNEALARCEDADLVLFVDENVWLDDWFLPERLQEALSHFDVVGVTGNRRRVPGQVSWHTVHGESVDKENLRGSVGQVMKAAETIIHFGDSPCEVKLLDGVFLAARAGRLRQAKVEFDPQFPVYFYDLDFCRTCERAGLKLGTWPIAITHSGEGNFYNPEWKEASVKYCAKWGE
jgi:hypothetical protein